MTTRHRATSSSPATPEQISYTPRHSANITTQKGTPMSIPLPPSMTSKSKPVRLLFAIAGGATILAGGLPLIPGVPGWLGAAVGLAGLVISGAVTIYTEQNTTPWADVAVKATPTGKLVAGPAAENLPNGAAVKVQGVAGQVVPGSATIGVTPDQLQDPGSPDTWQEGDAL